jgi:hypothetical protein
VEAAGLPFGGGLFRSYLAENFPTPYKLQKKDVKGHKFNVLGVHVDII